jgi:Flp pilus assembly protein TadD
LPAYLALSVRGADKERDELLEAFGGGIAPYREGRFREAADRLAPLAARRPDVPEVAFYLGAARLFAGDPAAAIAPLREARASEVVAHDARWFEAVASEHAGRREDADAALRDLCKLSGPYQARACAPVRGKQ